MTLVLVVIAGGLGSGARYLIGQWAHAAIGPQFPYGTVIVNLVGCFALGAVAQLSAAGSWTPEVRAAITAGFLGGFTTYSSFNQETIAMLTTGAMGTAVANITITLAGGIGAGMLGMLAVRLMSPDP